MTASDYVITPYLEGLINRASLYLEAGLAVHLRGPAGVGKSSLALHLAGRRGRPVHVVHGNESFGGHDLISRNAGYRSRFVVDNYVRRVFKRVEEVNLLWAEGPLQRAVRDGGSLVYDEFTRSRPEANSVLLGILEEGMAEVLDAKGHRQVKVHPEFRVIFTSNPEEYVGVYAAMDALLDRMVTLDMSGRDEATDVAIVAQSTGLSAGEAREVVREVKRRERLLGTSGASSLRPAIMIGRVLRSAGIPADRRNTQFKQVCTDIAGQVEEARRE